MHDSRNIPLVLGLICCVTVTLPCNAQQVDTTDHRRLDTTVVSGSAISRYAKGALRGAVIHIEQPHTIWLDREIDDNKRFYERVGYDQILFSYEMELGEDDSPDRVEFQVQDSVYQVIYFHKGTSIPKSVGRLRKYYGNYAGLYCIDMEDSTYTYIERQCEFWFNDFFRVWEKPCQAFDGEWLHYWPNGSLHSRGHYYPKDFRCEKIDTSYHVGNDFVFQVIEKDSKVKTGKWDYFDESGQMIRTVHYDPFWLNSPNRR